LTSLVRMAFPQHNGWLCLKFGLNRVISSTEILVDWVHPHP
jgi:hypothetical protein